MEANALAQSMLEHGSAFVHPFDNPTLWAGHATMIDEAAAANVPFDAVILCVGGGGLLSGVAEGLRRNGLGDVPVVAVETAGADSLAQSVAAGERIELAAITSVATSLGAKKVCANAWEVTRSHDVRCHVVSDLEALEACEKFLHDHRILVEPACGATLAAVYGRDQSIIAGFRAPLAIVCGGATVTCEQIREWRVKAAAAANHSVGA